MSRTPMLSSSWSFCMALLIHCHTYTHTHTQLECECECECVCVCLCLCLCTDVDEEVEQAGVECFGQGVSGETGLLGVQGDGDGLGLAAPLTVHDPAGQFTAQTVLRDPQQEGRERQD